MYEEVLWFVVFAIAGAVIAAVTKMTLRWGIVLAALLVVLWALGYTVPIVNPILTQATGLVLPFYSELTTFAATLTVFNLLALGIGAMLGWKFL